MPFLSLSQQRESTERSDIWSDSSSTAAANTSVSRLVYVQSCCLPGLLLWFPAQQKHESRPSDRAVIGQSVICVARHLVGQSWNNKHSVAFGCWSASERLSFLSVREKTKSVSASCAIYSLLDFTCCSVM